MRNLNLFISLLLSSVSYVQKGPAGVGDSTNNELWLVAHQLLFERRND